MFENMHKNMIKKSKKLNFQHFNSTTKINFI